MSTKYLPTGKLCVKIIIIYGVIMETINEYNNLINSFRLPRINEIPDLELYMDQVIIYVKKYFSIFPYETETNFITSSMINNYVKNGLMPPPIGKKYTKRHIAYIFTIFFLKQVFSLEEVKAFIRLQIRNSNEKNAYEQFCDVLEEELQICSSQNNINPTKETNIWDSTIRHTTISIANKLYSQSLIKYQIKK